MNLETLTEFTHLHNLCILYSKLKRMNVRNIESVIDIYSFSQLQKIGIVIDSTENWAKPNLFRFELVIILLRVPFLSKVHYSSFLFHETHSLSYLLLSSQTNQVDLPTPLGLSP